MPVYDEADLQTKQPLTLSFTPMCTLESPINLMCMYGLWEEAMST